MSTIVTRSGKGSPLSHVEVDANFNNLNTDKVEKTSAAITGGTINGTTIGGTTPAAGTFTTITGQTEVLNGTGQNLFTYSNTFNNAAWVNSSTTRAITGATTDPTGGSNAWIITSASGGGAAGITQSPSLASQTYTFSVYAKAGTSTWLRLFGPYPSTSFAWFNLSTGVLGTANTGLTSTITSAGSGWYRCSITGIGNGSCGIRLADANNGTGATDGTYLYIYGSQLELGSTVNTYIPTTTTAIYGTPTLSFSGVAGLGLQSDGSLYVSPAGTGALQAQATTSSTVGGNARGANAVDWQTFRGAASQVASGFASNISGGYQNTASGTVTSIAGGTQNTGAGGISVITGGIANATTATNYGNSYSFVGSGYTNTAGGVFNFIGGGYTNSGTSASAVTTQSGTMNATTAVTLSGSNANIKVGQVIAGTSISSFPPTYVAAISGTSLTLSQVASGSSTSTLSFYTPHGVVVGGGNNQATGAYSFIGGGGDAGTAANRNVASGDWSFVGGGRGNQATGAGSVVAGGGWDSATFTGNTASGPASAVLTGLGNTASGSYAVVLGGLTNTASGNNSSVLSGAYGTSRGLVGNTTFVACNSPIAVLVGASQSSLLVLARQTTDATPTALASNSAAAGTNNQVILPNNSAYFFTGEVVSGVTGGGNTKGWTIEGVIKRGANPASTALVGTPTVTSLYADAGAATWAIAVTADTTNGGIRVTFTGQAATTIRTVCQIRTTEMTY